MQNRHQPECWSRSKSRKIYERGGVIQSSKFQIKYSKEAVSDEKEVRRIIIN